jgi:hypothetical protein
LNDIGYHTPVNWGVLLRGHHDLDKGDLSQAGCHVVDGLAEQPAHLDVDLQSRPVAAGGRTLPEGRHETPFSKKLEHPWHHPGFGTGMNGKAGGGRKVIVRDRRGDMRHDRGPRQREGELTKPEPSWGPGL